MYHSDSSNERHVMMTAQNKIKDLTCDSFWYIQPSAKDSKDQKTAWRKYKALEIKTTCSNEYACIIVQHTTLVLSKYLWRRVEFTQQPLKASMKYLRWAPSRKESRLVVFRVEVGLYDYWRQNCGTHEEVKSVAKSILLFTCKDRKAWASNTKLLFSQQQWFYHNQDDSLISTRFVYTSE